MKTKYIQPQMVEIESDLENVIALSYTDEPANPEKPQEAKEEKNVWNEGLW